MKFNMILSSSKLDPEDLQKITLDMARAINSETEIEAQLLETTGEDGDKGDPTMLGQIVLTALTSGTIVTLFNVFKAYFDRQQNLDVKMKDSKGRQISITAKQLCGDHFNQTLEIANSFFEHQND